MLTCAKKNAFRLHSRQVVVSFRTWTAYVTASNSIVLPARVKGRLAQLPSFKVSFQRTELIIRSFSLLDLCFAWRDIRVSI